MKKYLREISVTIYTGVDVLQQGPVAGRCEHGSESSGPTNGGNFLTS
jgi:hypothetical protein